MLTLGGVSHGLLSDGMHVLAFAAAGPDEEREQQRQQREAAAAAAAGAGGAGGGGGGGGGGDGGGDGGGEVRVRGVCGVAVTSSVRTCSRLCVLPYTYTRACVSTCPPTCLSPSVYFATLICTNPCNPHTRATRARAQGAPLRQVSHAASFSSLTDWDVW